MTVLALDLGTRTGWAVSGGPSGVQSFATADRVTDTARHGRLFWRFGGWVGDMIVTYRPSVGVIEEMVGRSLKGNGGRVLLGMRATALAVLRGHDVLTEEVNKGTWQEWVRRAGYDWVKGDQADAKAMLAYWLAERADLVVGDAA